MLVVVAVVVVVLRMLLLPSLPPKASNGSDSGAQEIVIYIFFVWCFLLHVVFSFISFRYYRFSFIFSRFLCCNNGGI